MNKRNRFEYAPFTYGPWSSILEKKTRELERLGLVKYNGYACDLTEVGTNVAAGIFTHLPPVPRDRIARCVRKHGGKTTTEIQTYVHHVYPELHILGRAYPDD